MHGRSLSKFGKRTSKKISKRDKKKTRRGYSGKFKKRRRCNRNGLLTLKKRLDVLLIKGQRRNTREKSMRNKAMGMAA